MSDESREPVDENADQGATVEFEAVPEPLRERKEVKLTGHTRLVVKADFRHPIELNLGQDERTPVFYLLRNPSPRRIADIPYVIVQPDTVSTEGGWAEFGGPARVLTKVGRHASPQFELGPEVSRLHCLIAEHTGDFDLPELEIENYGRNGTRVLVHPDDLLREEAFTPDKYDLDPTV